MMPEKIAREWFEAAYEEWMQACGLQSHMREPTAQLVNQMQEAVQLRDYSAASYYMKRLKDLSDRFSVTRTGRLKVHTYELAETRMECARAAYLLEDKVEAMQLLLESAAKYTGHDHWRAVALWMLGCIQWQLRARANDAILSWESSCELFKTLAERSDQVEHALWYRDWQHVMQNAIELAIQGTYVSPPMHDEWPRNANIPAPATTDHTDFNVTNTDTSDAVLRSYSVYESVPAGGFAAAPISITRVETKNLCIDGAEYYVHNLRQGKIITLRDAEHYVVVKVTGDSMDRVGILDGEHVLLIVREAAESGDIVAFEIDSPGFPSGQTALRQFDQRNGKIVLRPLSNNPVHRPFEFKEKSLDFHIHGVAIAVLKKVS